MNVNLTEQNKMMKITKNDKNISKHKLLNETITNDEYMDIITQQIKKFLSIIPMKKPKKINDKDIVIPTINTMNEIIKNNYNVSQLKNFAKHYKLKISGNKNELTKRIFSFLYLSKYIIKIQKVFRGFLLRHYKNLHGPAASLKNRKLCTNSCDFITMEPLEEINFHQFLSYRDVDGFIYGFDISSLYNLISKSQNLDSILNPYNRNVIPPLLIKTVSYIIILAQLFNIYIKLNYEDDTQNVSKEQALQLRSLALFQNINALGNYSDSQWFLSLNKQQLIKFIHELADIWNYRAQILPEVKRNIYPQGEPFRNLSVQYIHTEENLVNVKTVILEVLEKFVNNGVDNDSKSLGSYYVLGALTLVNETAATSLPWLYQSFGFFNF